MATCRFSPKHKCLSWYRCCKSPTFKPIDKESRGLLKRLNRVKRDVKDLGLEIQKIAAEAPA